MALMIKKIELKLLKDVTVNKRNNLMIIILGIQKNLLYTFGLKYYVREFPAHYLPFLSY
jgi:hypothetical protein